MTTTVSASTLARQAAKTKNPKEAKRLRAAAAKLRREAREATSYEVSKQAELSKLVRAGRRSRKKAAKPRPAAKIEAGLKQALELAKNQTRREMLDNVSKKTASELNQALYGDNAQRAASPDSMPLSLTGIPWYQREEEVIKLMKAAKKPEEFKRELSNMIHASRYDGRLKVLGEQADAMSESNKRWAISIVAGFIARMNAEAKANGGPLPRSIIVDGATMARVVDALEKAGYTPDGVTGLRRAVGC